MRTLCRVAALIGVVLVFPRAVNAQLAPDWFGTWYLDVARSTFIGPAPYVRGTWRVEQGQGDEIVMIYHQVGRRGGVTHMEWKGVFDGADRRIHGPDAVVTYAYSLVGPRELSLQVKVDGRAAARARVVLESDGTVIATTENVTTRGPVTTMTVYRKR